MGTKFRFAVLYIAVETFLYINADTFLTTTIIKTPRNAFFVLHTENCIESKFVELCYLESGYYGKCNRRTVKSHNG